MSNTLVSTAPAVLIADVYPPGDKPEPSSLPDSAWIPGPGDLPHRMYHDDRRADWGYAPRTLRLKISISNEITRTCPPNGASTKVYPYAKIEIAMKRRRDWLDWIRATHGDWATERVYRPGYGYFDGAGTNPDVFTPANAFKLLLAGGQLVNVRAQAGLWSFLEAQSYPAGPDYAKTYQSHPHLVLKQCNVGNRPDKSMFIQVDKGEVGGVGDIYLPLCSDRVYPWISSNYMAAIETEFLEPFPSLPFVTRLHGYQVAIGQYAFSGSNTWGQVISGELDPGWYLLEEMLVTGDPADRTRGGSGDDRRVYVDNWLVSSPIPVIGWIRQA